RGLHRPRRTGVTSACDGAPGAASSARNRVGDPHGVRRHAPNRRSGSRLPRLARSMREELTGKRITSTDVPPPRLTANGLDRHYETTEQGPPMAVLHGCPEF